MSEEHYQRERLARGWLDLERDETDGVWRLRWSPDLGHPDYPGVSYGPRDSLLPPDFPTTNEAGALLAWGRRHLG